MELKLEHVSKQYKGTMAVNDFSITLGTGIHALLGANGAGKTTLMRMICGLIRPTEGVISIDQVPIEKAGEGYRELLGYLPQNYGYYPNFTGWDFMMYLAALKGLPRITAQEKSEELLHQFGLYTVRNKKMKTYSGGMRQRAGIAQALLNDPKILVVDEPTAGLDPKERVKFRHIIEQLEKDRIIILSTHIVPDVEKLCDDVIIMKDGRKVHYGPEHENLETMYLQFFDEKEGYFDEPYDD